MILKIFFIKLKIKCFYLFINKILFLRSETAFCLQKCIMEHNFTIRHESLRTQAMIQTAILFCIKLCCSVRFYTILSHDAEKREKIHIRHFYSNLSHFLLSPECFEQKVLDKWLLFSFTMINDENILLSATNKEKQNFFPLTE
jgi:hypothetical protein